MKRPGFALFVDPTPLGLRNGVKPRRLGIYITEELAGAVAYFEKMALQRRLATTEEDRRGVRPWEQLMEFAIRPGVIGECRSCGCTDERACPEGCFWIQSDLCSSCVDQEDLP